MCNLYSVTKGQAAIIALTRALRDTTGNLPSMPGVFPDYMAPVVRNNGIRELAMLRWGMPGPPQFGGAPITNIRNVRSPHWRGWLKPENRCVVRSHRSASMRIRSRGKLRLGSHSTRHDRSHVSQGYGRPGRVREVQSPDRRLANINFLDF